MNKAQLRDYLEYLKDDFEFHLDDDPHEIVWTNKLTPEELDHICSQHRLMWESFTAAQIWDLASEVWNIGE